MNLNDIAKKGKDEENPPNRNVLPTPLNADHSALSFLHAAYEALNFGARRCRGAGYQELLYEISGTGVPGVQGAREIHRTHYKFDTPKLRRYR